MAEVIKVVGDNAYVQVFDSTRGLKIGEKVEFEGHMLEATLAPGLLSRNYDGLQNDLEKMDGLFIARGSITDLSTSRRSGSSSRWPSRRQGFGRIVAGPGQGGVGRAQDHGTLHDGGNLYGQERRARRRVQGYGHDRRHHRCRRSGSRYYDGSAVAREAGRALLPGEATPSRVMETGVRAIDTFNPLAEGGTGFIPDLSVRVRRCFSTRSRSRPMPT